jgi:hypothetical protein
MPVNRQVSPSNAVCMLLEAAVPELIEELRALWKKYNPSVVIEDDKEGRSSFLESPFH